MNFTLLLLVNVILQPDLTGLLKSVDGLFEMIGSILRRKKILYFHQVIGGNIDEKRGKGRISKNGI